jgi:hypothetical protein
LLSEHPVNVLKNKFSRRKFLTTVGLAGLGGTAYARWVEPGWLEVGRHEVAVSKASGKTPFKILHLSDLHASPVVDLDFLQSALELGLKQQPDVICLTGDFITGKFSNGKEYAKVLSPLAAAAPTFASLGNHDGGHWACRPGAGGYADTKFIRGVFSEAKVTLLHNDMASVQKNGWNVTVAGLGDVWAHEMEPDLAFGRIPADRGDATVLLSHNPDTKTELHKYPWDLMLCGHTHGGQVCLPFIGAPYTPVQDKSILAGLYRWNDRWIHVTRGVGSIMGVRFNCRPEVSILTLT